MVRGISNPRRIVAPEISSPAVGIFRLGRKQLFVQPDQYGQRFYCGAEQDRRLESMTRISGAVWRDRPVFVVLPDLLELPGVHAAGLP
ncbi:hypothetical protein D3C76_1647830 [compost metagenome]